jgi:hypothetical protein
MDSTDKLLREQGFEVRYSQYNKITYADKLIKDKVSQLPPEQLPLNLAATNYIDLMRHSDAIVGEHEFELLQ